MQIWWLLANAYYKLRQLEDAINCCINILAIEPYHYKALAARHQWEAEYEILSMEIGREHVHAATGIQSAFRARKARKRVDKIKQEKREQAQAATMIQSSFRQKKARKEVKKKRAKKVADDKKKRQDPMFKLQEKKKETRRRKETKGAEETKKITNVSTNRRIEKTTGTSIEKKKSA